MAYKYCVMPDPDELGYTPGADDIMFAVDDNRLDRTIREASKRKPFSTIVVYQLCGLHKVKDQPTYQRYKVTSAGEILPE